MYEVYFLPPGASALTTIYAKFILPQSLQMHSTAQYLISETG
jgi:hypothetical protein